MSIRRAEARDLPVIAAIHKSQFESHFLGHYSPRLLEKFYETFLGRSVFLVEMTAEELDGYILGLSSHRISLCKILFIITNLWRCFWETLVRPSLWLEGLRRGFLGLVLPELEYKPPAQGSKRPETRILCIAVRKEVMGRGIAVALLDAFERVIRDNRIEEYGLSVFKTNQRAIHFYEKMGFTVDDENNRSIYFSKRLSPASNERCGDGGGEKC